MLESLEQLSDAIDEAGGQLETFYGDNNKVIRSIILASKPDCKFFNADYSPYAINRDKDITELCKKYEISTVSINDYYLFEPGTILNGSGQTYQKSPFL